MREVRVVELETQRGLAKQGEAGPKGSRTKGEVEHGTCFGLLARRHVIVSLCALCAFVCYADRVIISIAVITMAKEFEWDLILQGQILGAFFYGYVMSQIVGAHLAKVYGGKGVLNAAVAGWSLLTVLTPIVAKISLPALLLCRVLLGFSEGMSFPVTYHIFSQWVPKSESSRSVVSLNVGTCTGTVVAFVVSPWLIEQMGWESVFYFFGWTGILWCAVWQVYGADKEPPSPEAFNWKLFCELLRPSGLYSIYFCHFSWNMTLYISVMWLPTYLENAYNLDSKETWINSLPYLVMAPSAFGWGVVVDRYIAKSESTLWPRKVATLVGFVGGAIGLVSFSRQSNAHAAIFLLCATFCISALSLSGWEAAKLNALESSQAGMLQGVSNTIANFSGVVGVPLASYVKKVTDSWHAVWMMCAAIWVAAACVYAVGAQEGHGITNKKVVH